MKMSIIKSSFLILCSWFQENEWSRQFLLSFLDFLILSPFPASSFLSRLVLERLNLLFYQKRD